MERKDERSELIELGVASTETKGFVGRKPDIANGLDGTALIED